MDDISEEYRGAPGTGAREEDPKSSQPHDSRQSEGPSSPCAIRSHWYLAGLISLITCIVYLPTLRHDFVNWDDYMYIIENPSISSFDPAFFKWAFSSFYAGNWHPLTWISHALDYAVWGLDPMGHHLTNNILHAVNTFLVVLLTVRLIESAQLPSRLNTPSAPPLNLRGGWGELGTRTGSLIVATTTGLLFGLHPIHVESVAWVAERKDLLCALFFLLSVMAYIRYAARRTYSNYFFSIAFFVLALLSKPMAVSLPVVLLILDWYPLGRVRAWKDLWKVFPEKIPFIALSLVSSVLTILAQISVGAIDSMELVPLSSRLLVAAKSLLAYLSKMLFPVELVPYYPYPSGASLSSMEYVLPLIIVMGITVLSLVIAGRQKLWLTVWGYYVITLLPVLGIVQVGAQSMADRYTYLPSLGPFLAAGVAVAWASKRINTLKEPGLIIKFVGFSAVIAALLSLSYLTFEQTMIWKNSLNLWNYIIKKEPEEVPFAYKNRGNVFNRNGLLPEAIRDYNKAISLNQNDAKTFINRGLAYLKIGQVSLAVSDFRKACELGDAFGCSAPKYLLKNGS